MTLSQQAFELCELSREQLRGRFDAGHPVDLGAITGYRYLGVSLGPRWGDRGPWMRFAKTFERSEQGVVHGHNLRIEPGSLESDWRPVLRDGEPLAFGPYRVTKVPGTEHVEIDYGLGSRGISPLRLLRDPLRRLDAGNDLLLGCTLIDFGLAHRFATPLWFLLQRDAAL